MQLSCRTCNAKKETFQFCNQRDLSWMLPLFEWKAQFHRHDTCVGSLNVHRWFSFLKIILCKMLSVILRSKSWLKKSLHKRGHKSFFSIRHYIYIYHCNGHKEGTVPKRDLWVLFQVSYSNFLTEPSSIWYVSTIYNDLIYFLILHVW